MARFAAERDVTIDVLASSAVDMSSEVPMMEVEETSTHELAS